MFRETRVPKAGFTTADPQATLPADCLILGSKNLMFRGQMELESVGGWKLTNYGGLSSNRGGDVSNIVGSGWATIGDQLAEGSGNVTEFVGRSLWFTGTGDITVYQPGITTTPQALGNSALQNNIPQIAVLNDSKNGYKVPVQVGLLRELNVPVIRSNPTPGSGFQGLMNGTYALQYTYIRESTGAESLPTDPSNVISLTNNSVVIKFFNGTLPTNAVLPRDKFRVYGTPANFGFTGPFLFFKDIPVRRIIEETGFGYAIENPGSGNNVFRVNPTIPGFFSTEQIGKVFVILDVTGLVVLHAGLITSVTANTFTVNGVTYGDKVTFTPAYSTTTSNTNLRWIIGADNNLGTVHNNEIELEYADNQLLSVFPPTDSFPPSTTAQFIVGLVNVMCLVGTENGLGVAVSTPNFPESYPPDFRLQLPEKPTGVLHRPLDGLFYIVCANCVNEVRWTGAVDGPPVSLRTVVEQVGAIGQKAMCQAGPDIYLYTPSHKAVRLLSAGIMDAAFGDRVEKELLSWNANDVVVSYDERKNFVMYAYQDRALLYYPAYDVWSPLIFPADTESAGRPDGNIRSIFTLNGLVHESHYFSYTPTVSINASSNLVNTGVSFFTHRHLGRTISIPGAGSGPSTLTAVITGINGVTQAVINQNASFTVSSVLATVDGFDMWTFDRGLDDIELQFSTSWIARFPFSDYGVGLNPKTVTHAKVGIKATSGTYNLRFFKNYVTSSEMGTTRTFTPPTGSSLSKEIDCENGEAELFSVQVDGSGVRNKLFFIQVTGDDSGISINN